MSSRLWLSVSALMAVPTLAAGQPVGGEFQINTYTTGDQNLAAAATDAEGNFVVVWQSDGQDGDGNGIFGQRYDANGNALGSEFQVNTHTTDTQYDPAVAASPAGDFVVVWTSLGQDGSGGGVFAQRYEATGGPLGGEFRVNTQTVGSQGEPAVAVAADGDFVVVWAGPDVSVLDVFGQRYDAAGNPLGGEFQVNTYTAGRQYAPAVAANAEGDFVVAWNGYGQDDSFGVFGQRFAASGSPRGSEFRVNSFTPFSQLRPAVAADAEGNFVVVWDGYNLGTFFFGGIDGQRYDASGVPLGNEFEVSTPGYGSYGSRAAVSVDAEGEFVVVWDEPSAYGRADPSVFAREYDSSGNPRSGWFEVNTHQGFACCSTVAADAGGNYVVAWGSDGQDGEGFGVFGQRWAGASLALSVEGTCPGQVAVTLLGAPPNSEVAVVAAANNNGFTKGGALCPGTQLVIGEPFKLPPTWVLADPNGTAVGNFNLPANRCWVQALALEGCETSNAVEVPLE